MWKFITWSCNARYTRFAGLARSASGKHYIFESFSIAKTDFFSFFGDFFNYFFFLLKWSRYKMFFLFYSFWDFWISISIKFGTRGLKCRIENNPSDKNTISLHMGLSDEHFSIKISGGGINDLITYWLLLLLSIWTLAYLRFSHENST